MVRNTELFTDPLSKRVAVSVVQGCLSGTGFLNPVKTVIN